VSTPTVRPTAMPAVLRWAIVIFAVDTVGVWAYVGFLIYADLTRPGDGRGVAVTVYFALYALAFAGITYALARRRSWARGPAIVLQLMLAAIGYYMIQGGLAFAGVPVLSLAVTGIGLLLVPAAREGLGVRS
jgi:hypothetical protein